MARLTLGDTRLLVYEIDEGTGLELFRIVRGEGGQQPALVDSFRSHYELGLLPLRTERRAAVIHMRLSTYRTESQARGAAVRFPATGTHLARLRLQAGRGLNFAATGHPGHVTVRVDPLTSAQSVVDIEPVAS